MLRNAFFGLKYLMLSPMPNCISTRNAIHWPFHFGKKANALLCNLRTHIFRNVLNISAKESDLFIPQNHTPRTVKFNLEFQSANKNTQFQNSKTQSVTLYIITKHPVKKRASTQKSFFDRNTQLADDVMIARAKKIYILIIEINEWLSFFRSL